MPKRTYTGVFGRVLTLNADRDGSILIIVISLLVLLALMGAAFLASARSTRVSSAQNVLTTAQQLELEGIGDAVTGIIANDLNDDWGNLRGNAPAPSSTNHQNYRGKFSPGVMYNIGDIVNYQVLPSPPYSPSFFVCIAPINLTSAAPTAPAFAPASAYWQPTTHVPVTSTLVQTWLADRIPTLGVDGATPTWPNISQTATTSAYPTSVLGLPFESPDGNSASPPQAQAVPGATYINLQPTYTSLQSGKLTVPAFNIGAGPTNKFIAGDADGDGIADCLLSRVPGMSVGGLTWYVGIRIIDNNSAINANTAWSSTNDFSIASGSPIPNYYGLFQTGVGLQELIAQANTGDSFKNLTSYRFNNTAPGATPFDEAGFAPSGSPLLYAPPQGRSDFIFITQTDELYHQLIRRLANPGCVSANYLAQSLSWSDSATLASRFCLINPGSIQSPNPSSLIETLLPLSTFQGAQSPAASPYFNSTPYGIHGTDADVAQWYLDNFNFDGSAVSSPDPGAANSYGSKSVFPLRPFLTTRNPVSNYITPIYDTKAVGEPLQVPQLNLPPTATAADCQMMLPWGNTPTVNHYQGYWSQDVTSYKYNDIVRGPDGFTYIWINSNPGNTNAAPTIHNLINATPAIYGQWQLQPWNPNPTKANINTATFRELFRDFWCVMAGNNASGINTSPYGMTPIDNNIYESDPALNQQCMFRSPLRDCTSNVGTPLVNQLDGGALVSGVNTMQLRAALAAVNAIGLRSGSQDVISRTIILNNASISAGPSKPSTAQPVQVRVYSSAPQPVISEVYVNTYADDGDPNYTGSSNPKGYVAIELYNPYGVPLTLNNWQVGYIPRTAVTYPNLAFPNTTAKTDLAIGPMIPLYRDASPPNPLSTIIIPAHGYALLENYNPVLNPASLPENIRNKVASISTFDAHYRPATMFPDPYSAWTHRNNRWRGPGISDDTPDNTPGTTVDVWVPGLSNVIADIVPDASGDLSLGGEFVLLRPRRADGTFTQSGHAIKPPSSTSPLSEYYNEGTSDTPNLADLVPVDSYDFTGLQQTGPGSATYNVWSYMRPKGQGSDTNPSQVFRSTYPGPYTTISTIAAPARELWTDPEDTLPTTRPDDLQTVTWKVYPPATKGAISNNGAEPLFGAYFAGLINSNVTGNTFLPIQVYNVGPDSTGKLSQHFPNPVITQPGDYVSPQQQFPFGSFARNGDMLEVPYIGAYRISLLNPTQALSTAQPQTFLELNSLPMDSAMAAIDDANDTIGPHENIGRFIPLSNSPGYTGVDNFSWTRNLFNYFTVQSTSDNYFPNIDPGLLDVTVPAHLYANQTGNTGMVYPPGNSSANSISVMPPNVTQTHNRDAAATDELAQDNVGIDGLVNINTASYQILSQLPMVSPSDPLKNQKLAKAIIAWRTKNGPFMSLFDLNSVINSTDANGFQNEEGTITSFSNVSSQQGILTPPDPLFPRATPITTGIAEDFQGDNVALTHISNMITTRSDTFTVYIVLQGWANAGTADAYPVLTRRSAFIVDRSAISPDPSSRSIKTITVPAD